MARDGKTARREPAELRAPTRQPVPRPDGDGAVPPLPPPDPGDPMSYSYTTDLAAIRAVVHRYAIQAGLTEARAVDLTLAVSEVAANTIKHAKSPGSLNIWYDAKEIVCQIHDEGVITDPQAGRREPSLDAVGGARAVDRQPGLRPGGDPVGRERHDDPAAHEPAAGQRRSVTSRAGLPGASRRQPPCGTTSAWIC